MTPPALLGVYAPPQARAGGRVFCLYRDAACTVTSWHAGPVPWPRCSVGKGGGWGLWVNDDLKRAVETEAAAAVAYWFGVSLTTVWRWRRAFGVGRFDPEGSRVAHRRACSAGAAAVKAKVWTDAELDAKSETARRIGLPPPATRWAETGWTIDELALLGTVPDADLAAKLGRTRDAVRAARVRRRVPACRAAQ